MNVSRSKIENLFKRSAACLMRKYVSKRSISSCFGSYSIDDVDGGFGSNKRDFKSAKSAAMTI